MTSDWTMHSITDILAPLPPAAYRSPIPWRCVRPQAHSRPCPPGDSLRFWPTGCGGISSAARRRREPRRTGAALKKCAPWRGTSQRAGRGRLNRQARPRPRSRSGWTISWDFRSTRMPQPGGTGGSHASPPNRGPVLGPAGCLCGPCRRRLGLR